MTQSSDRWPRGCFIVVLLSLCIVAASIRIAFIPVSGGGNAYLDWSRLLYYGSISNTAARSAEALLHGQGYDQLSRPPGYAIMLAGLMRVGVGMDGWRVVQALVDALSVTCLVLLAVWIGVRRPVAILIAVPPAVMVPWTIGSTFLLAEWIAPLAVAGLLAAIMAPGDRRRAWRWAAIGLGLGVAIMFRPDLALLGPLLAAIWGLLWLRRASPREVTGTGLAALVLACALPIGAWAAHNRLVHGHWVILSTSGGSALYQGLGAIPNEHGYELGDQITAAMLAERGIAWGSIEADRELKRMWREALRAHPRHVLRVTKHRWTMILTQLERPVGLRNELGEVIVRWSWLIVAIGAALLLARRRPDLCLVMMTPLLLALFANGLTHTEMRYVRAAPFTTLLALGTILTMALELATAAVRRTMRDRAVAVEPIVQATMSVVVAAVVAIVATTLTVGAVRSLAIEWARTDSATALATSLPSAGDTDWMPLRAPWHAIGGAEITRHGDGFTLSAPVAGVGAAVVPTLGLDAFALRIWGRVTTPAQPVDLWISEDRRIPTRARLTGDGPWTVVAGVASHAVQLRLYNPNQRGPAATLHVDRIEILPHGSSASELIAEREAWRVVRGDPSASPSSVRAIDAIAWRAEGGARIEIVGDATQVITDEHPGGYQVATPIADCGDWIAVRYRVRVEEGGVSIGLLSGDRQRWLATAALPGAGLHEGWIVAVTGDSDAVVLMLSNMRPEGGSSRVTIEAVEVHETNATRE